MAQPETITPDRWAKPSAIQSISQCAVVTNLMDWMVTPSRHRLLLPTLVIVLFVAGCSPANEEPTSTGGDARETPEAVTTTQTSQQPAPDDKPIDALKHYYRLIEAGRFEEAYNLWRQGGASHPDTSADLRSRYADVSQIEAGSTGPTRYEGAAGTVYATVPLRLTKHLKSGEERSLTGQCVLARANDVPGSGDSDQSWHLHSCQLTQNGQPPTH